MDEDVSHHPKYWMPLVWAGSIVTRARKENRIANDYMMLALIEVSHCGLILHQFSMTRIFFGQSVKEKGAKFRAIVMAIVTYVLKKSPSNKGSKFLHMSWLKLAS